MKRVARRALSLDPGPFLRAATQLHQRTSGNDQRWRPLVKGFRSADFYLFTTCLGRCVLRGPRSGRRDNLTSWAASGCHAGMNKPHSRNFMLVCVTDGLSSSRGRAHIDDYETCRLSIQLDAACDGIRLPRGFVAVRPTTFNQRCGGAGAAFCPSQPPRLACSDCLCSGQARRSRRA